MPESFPIDKFINLPNKLYGAYCKKGNNLIIRQSVHGSPFFETGGYGFPAEIMNF